MGEEGMGSEGKGSGKYRQLSGIGRFFSAVFLGAIPILCLIYTLDIHTRLGYSPYKEQYLGLFLALALSSTFLNIPARKTSPKDKVPWYDVLLVLLSFVVAGNVALFYPDLIIMLGLAKPAQAIMGAIAILLLLEAVRRVIGIPLLVIGVAFILYARFSYLFPGLLYARGVSWRRLFSFLYLDPNSLLGIPTGVAGTFVIGFLFFGACLFMVGGGEFLTNIALALMGKARGGPAKVATIASALFGSLSGSSSANVAVTGVVSIPMMKKTGYTPQFAGAVEATASTGGLVLPPVMGITAFMMAEFLGIPYYQVAIASAIPAVFYYVAVFTQVHIEALKAGIEGLPPEDLPSLKAVMKDGWIYLIPIAGLIYFLFFMHLNPTASAMYAAIMMIGVGLVRKGSRHKFLSKLSFALQDTGRQVLVVATACATAGLVIGSVSVTNLGLSLSKTLIAVSGGNTFLLLVLAAFGAIVLGMGMPIAATYIMLVILIAPALVNVGIEPLAAHLFVNYFAAMSFVTPPVCIACFVAAGIAGSAPMKTGFTSMRLGIAAYLVPFAFCYSLGLLLIGSAGDIVLAVLTTFIAVTAIAIALSGYLYEKLKIPQIVLFVIGGIMLLVPRHTTQGTGFLLIMFLFAWEHIKAKRRKRPS